MASFKFDDSGFKKAMKDLEKKAASISGKYRLDEIFDAGFMRKNTKFSSIATFLEECGIHDEAEFESFPDATLDKFVKGNSNFKSWEEMKNAAGVALAEKKLK